MKNSNISTGYFARAKQNGHGAKWTKVHLVADGVALCGYKPHKTMQFLWNSQGVHLPYVECDKCKEELKYFFTVDVYEQHNRDQYYVKFNESPFGISMKDVVQDCGKSFDTEDEAQAWGKRCVRLYKKFNMEVGANDVSVKIAATKGKLYVYRLQNPKNPNLRTYEIGECDLPRKNKDWCDRRICEGFWGDESKVKSLVNLLNIHGFPMNF